MKASTLPQPPGLREILRSIAVAASKIVAGVFGFARDSIARGIIRAGIPVNAVTLTGPVAVSLVFMPAYYGTQWLAGVVLIAAGAFDMLDGAVARISRGTTKFGGFLDSVTDRYTDLLMLFGILAYLLKHVQGPSRTMYLILWGFTAVGTATTSYIRARAETEIPECKVGFMERAERTVTIIIGLLAANVHITLWILGGVRQSHQHPAHLLYTDDHERPRAQRPVLAVALSSADSAPLHALRDPDPVPDHRALDHPAALDRRRAHWSNNCPMARQQRFEIAPADGGLAILLPGPGRGEHDLHRRRPGRKTRAGEANRLADPNGHDSPGKADGES